MGGAGELCYIDGYTHIGYIPSSFLLSGALFYEVTRVLRATRPAAFLLENVPNLQHVDGGRAMSTILAQLDAAGYIVIHRALNARPLVPQRRVRLYFVGFRKDNTVTTTPPCSMGTSSGTASSGAASRTASRTNGRDGSGMTAAEEEEEEEEVGVGGKSSYSTSGASSSAAVSKAVAPQTTKKTKTTKTTKTTKKGGCTGCITGEEAARRFQWPAWADDGDTDLVRNHYIIL